jgi:uncharacterized protein YbjQ (UPF0145 family)
MPGHIDQRRLPITTTFDPPPGYVVTQLLGTCWGITVRSRSIGGQIVAGLESMVGGEVTMYSELAATSRNEAVQRMEDHAIQMGGNCILGMRFDSSDLMQNTNEIIAYGTAVVVVPVSQ